MNGKAATELSAGRRQLGERLLARIHRRYATTTITTSIGPLSFPFTRIADPDRVLDDIAREADRREKLTGRRQGDEDLYLPYWAELWDSATGIGEFLARLDAEARGRGDTKRKSRAGVSYDLIVPATPCLGVSASFPAVLDLGCGMGLSGTVAAALGARVTFADLESSALLFARLNSLPWRSRVRTRRLNWRTDHLDQTFDLILGADILYERAQWEWLEPFWREHLAHGGTVLLGEPGRQTGDLFVDWIAQRDWILERFEQPVATRPRPVRIFRLQPRSPA